MVMSHIEKLVNRYLKNPTQQIEQLLTKHFTITGSHTIDPVTHQVHVKGHVIMDSDLSQLPVQFGRVTGYFDCSHCKLKTLSGAPVHVGGSFMCDHNLLKNLHHAPVHVGGSFMCAHNPLQSLTGAPDHVGDTFVITYSSHLPLLRVLVAHMGVSLEQGPTPLKAILNDPAHVGKGKAVAVPVTVKLIRAGFKGNARW